MIIRNSLRAATVLATTAAAVLGLAGVSPASAQARRADDPAGTQVLTSASSGFPDVPQLWNVAGGGVLFTDATGTWVQPVAGGAARSISGPGSSIVGSAGPMLWVVDGTGDESWINTSTGATGTVAFQWKAPSPTGGLYELLSPKGQIHVLNNNAVSDKLTDLGAVGTWSGSADVLVPGPNGVLVVGKKSTGVVGMTYLTYTAKKILPNITGIPAGNVIKCVSVSAAGAGCIDQTANAAIGISFTGAAPTYVPQSQPITGGPVVTSTTMAWTVHGNTDDVLHSVPARGGTESVLAAPTAGAGKGLVTDGTSVFMPTAGDTAGDTGSIASVVDATGTPASIRDDVAQALQTTEIALGPGRVSWADNATKSEPLWSRTNGAPGPISLGNRTNVANGLTPNGLYVSGRYTAFDDDNGFPVVSDGTTTTTVPQPGPVVGLSGTHMMYMRNGGYHPMMYDILTAKPTDLKTTYPSMSISAPVALYGNYVLFFQDDGSVWRGDFTTTRPAVRVSPGLGANRTIVYGAIWSSNNWVAWNVVTTDGTNYYTYNQYVDTSSGNAPSNAPANTTIVGAGEAGLVLMADNADSLLSWDGANTMPLSGNGAVTDGDRVAWIGSDGVPRIAQVSYPVNEQPVVLSSPVTATALDTNNSWSLALPTSAPLATCNVSFVDAGGNTVDTVPCDANAAAVGEVRVNWVPPAAIGFGQYTWQLNARNADGQLLMANGAAGQLTGPVTVGVIVTGATPASLPQGATSRQVVVSGYRFDSGAVPSFGSVVKVLSVVVNSSTQLTATVSVLANAATGPRNITVTDPGSVDGVCSRCFAIT